MYNRLYKHLSCNNIFYRKQFGFQEKNSTKHAIMQLVDQINCSFEKNIYTLDIFIDLSKAFDTVDHKIIITKLENYGVTGTNLRWFKSYLENRKQCISILAPLLFLVYVNAYYKTSDVLDPIMLANDTNLFYSYQNIGNLFGTVYCELQKICELFGANKLSLHVTKTNYTSFHKNSTKEAYS